MTKANCTNELVTKQTSKQYKHLSKCDRKRLSHLLNQDFSQRRLATIFNVSVSTINREIKRGRAASKTGVYSYRGAQKQIDLKRIQANQQHRKLHRGSPLEDSICYYLEQYSDPEQIAGGTDLDISKNSIYHWLHGLNITQLKALRPYLRHKEKRRKAGTKARLKLQKHSHKRNIAQRSQTANKRQQIGHWEGDTIVGSDRSTRLVTLVERSSGYLLVAFVPRATKELFAEACIQLLTKVKPTARLSLTLDNGSEMNDFKKIEEQLKIIIYFADPYASYQRGTNENTNGLLRQFFPKGFDFKQITSEQLAKVTDLINNRPRKRHGFKSPTTVLQEHLNR